MTVVGKSCPERGVSLFSCSDVLNVCMTLEDCLEDIEDVGATRVEILASQVPGYPNPSAEWNSYLTYARLHSVLTFRPKLGRAAPPRP